jgi:DNA polymerase
MIDNCDKCKLCINNNFVPSKPNGNIKSPIYFIGDYSVGVDKEFIFSGKTGNKLKSYINSNNLSHCSYLTSIVKCRPSIQDIGNIDIINTCKKYVFNEIIYGNPKIIILMGSIAINTYFNIKLPSISIVNNKPFMYKGKIIICTYHPAYILKNKGTEVHYIKLFKIIKQLKHVLNIL